MQTDTTLGRAVSAGAPVAGPVSPSAPVPPPAREAGSGEFGRFFELAGQPVPVPKGHDEAEAEEFAPVENGGAKASETAKDENVAPDVELGSLQAGQVADRAEMREPDLKSEAGPGSAEGRATLAQNEADRQISVPAGSQSRPAPPEAQPEAQVEAQVETLARNLNRDRESTVKTSPEGNVSSQPALPGRGAGQAGPGPVAGVSEKPVLSEAGENPGAGTIRQTGVAVVAPVPEPVPDTRMMLDGRKPELTGPDISGPATSGSEISRFATSGLMQSGPVAPAPAALKPMAAIPAPSGLVASAPVPSGAVSPGAVPPGAVPPGPIMSGRAPADRAVPGSVASVQAAPGPVMSGMPDPRPIETGAANPILPAGENRQLVKPVPEGGTPGPTTPGPTGIRPSQADDPGATARRAETPLTGRQTASLAQQTVLQGPNPGNGSLDQRMAASSEWRFGAGIVSENTAFFRGSSDGIIPAPLARGFVSAGASPVATASAIPAGIAHSGLGGGAPLRGGIDLATAFGADGMSEQFLSVLSDTAQQARGTSSLEAMAARPETARLVAAQMANALINVQGSKVEIALNPKELGRVRMVVSATDIGVSISITAERPETLDMMRRHIDQLADEFHNMGYENIAFEFSGGDTRDDFGNESTHSGQNSETKPVDGHDMPEPGPDPISRPAPSRGLDLRL